MTHAVKRVMDVDGVDWLIDAPVPCPTCGKEAVAKVAILKTRNSVACRYCGSAIDLTDPGTRAYLEEFSSVVCSLLSGSDKTAKN
jgi:transcription elongation factor Elf1